MKNDKNKQLRFMAACGVEFVSAVMVGMGLGGWLDKYFHKFPIFLIIFFLLGCISGYFNIIRHINETKK
ncbi:MAG: AtpZ/AtpI family protein [Holosporaceae bacterium]|jgi:F0F1-type ATP synthase assembly protein I|nr:AtpZ/AtpI family protein [Holosporaceae bacterium]